jgi:HEAT repeat protein
LLLGSVGGAIALWLPFRDPRPPEAAPRARVPDAAPKPKPPERPVRPAPTRPLAVLPFSPSDEPVVALDLELLADTPPGGFPGGLPVVALPPLDRPRLVGASGDLPDSVPSLPPQEERRLDTVVNRFIRYDIGRLRGLEGQRALLDFRRLGPEAIPALVRGLNKSCMIEASCPCLVIRARLTHLLQTCRDPELLIKARDNIGRGVVRPVHLYHLTALRQLCEQRLETSRELLRERIPQLIGALKAPTPAVRREAANTLGCIGRDAHPAAPALVAVLRDADPQVRGRAGRALAEIGPRAVPLLLDAARTIKEPEARALAYLALAESRPLSAATVRALAADVKATRPELRAPAHLALARIGTASIPHLVAALREGDAGAAVALGLIGPPAAAAVEPLAESLGSRTKDLRIAAHHALVRIGSSSVAPLVRALPSADPKVRFSAAIALGKIGRPAPEVVSALTRTLRDPVRAIRLAALSALVRIDPENREANPALAEAVPVLHEALRHKNPALRTWAAASLAKVGREARRVRDRLIECLRDPSPLVRTRAAEALGRIDPDNRRAAKALVQALRDTSPAVRTAAGASLVRLGAVAVPDLLEQLRQATGAARASAVLARIGPAAVPGLKALLADGDPDLRARSAACLRQAGPRAKAAASSVREALADGNTAVRREAALALAAVDPGSAGAVLVACLKDPESEVRLAAGEALAQLGRPVVPLLASSLDDRDPRVRREAALTLKRVGESARSAIGALTRALGDPDSEVRARAADALREVMPRLEGPPDEPTRQALAALVDQLQDPEEEVHIAAHLALIKVGPGAVPFLAAGLQARRAALRRGAVETLKKIGPEASAAVPDLIVALKDTDDEVREGAGWALEEIDAELKKAVPGLLRALAAPATAHPLSAGKRKGDWAERPVAELLAAIGNVPEKHHALLTELANRPGEQTIIALARCLFSDDEPTRGLGRTLLGRHLSGRPTGSTEDNAQRALTEPNRLLTEGRKAQAHTQLRRLIRLQPRTRAAERARETLAGQR